MTGVASLALLMTGSRGEPRRVGVYLGANGANFIYGDPDVPATSGKIR